jgi:hypothetical protein
VQPVKVQNEENAARLRTQRRLETVDGLKPTAFVRDVSIDEIFVALCEVDDALDEADDSADAASANGDHDLDYSFLCVTEYEFVNAQSANQDAADSSGDFLVRSRYFFAHRFPFLSRFLCLFGK